MDRADSESATHYTLRVRYSDMRVTRSLPDNIILKVYCAGRPLADREVTFYATILPALRRALGAGDLGVCDGYDAYYDIDADQAHVLIAGLPTGFKRHHELFPPARRHFAHLADTLARFHARFWQDDRLGETIGLAMTDARLDDTLARQRDGFERFLSDGMIRLDPDQRAVLSAVAGRMPVEARERLLAGRQLTVIHNDLKPGNLAYSHQACRILDYPYDEFLRDYRSAIGLRLGAMIGSWQKDDWRDGKWRQWDAILAGLRAFEEHNVEQLFPV